MASTRGTVVALYREVLRLHRRLPTDLRFVGDAYVKDEWRKHLTAEARYVGTIR
jgi:hypothetical protein